VAQEPAGGGGGKGIHELNGVEYGDSDRRERIGLPPFEIDVRRPADPIVHFLREMQVFHVAVAALSNMEIIQ